MNESEVRFLRGAAEGNNLLRLLREDDFALLRPNLRPHVADPGATLYNPGDRVAAAYFPCGPTLVSFMVAMENGNSVETMLIGREGAVGGIVSQGNMPAYAKSMVQIGGDFLTIPLSSLDAAKSMSKTLNNLFARYADCMLAQVFQTTACNAAHSIEQRTAKWILSAMDRIGDDAVPLTQERIAAMLGVGRSYISRVIGTFKDENILGVRRGALLVLDREKLSQRSCGCNGVVRDHFETVLKGVYPSDGDAA